MGVLAQSTVILLIAYLFDYTHGYPDGQVQGSCLSMVPIHGAIAQTSAAPYSLSLSRSNYSAGTQITVTLSANSGAPQFKGFLIQARSGSSTVPVGSFVTTNSKTQTLKCTTTASSVSHTSAIGKSSIVVTWVAPNSNMTNIQIKATVVQTERVFWTNVVSAKITYISSNGVSTTTVASPSTSNTMSSTIESTEMTTSTSEATATTSKVSKTTSNVTTTSTIAATTTTRTTTTSKPTTSKPTTSKPTTSKPATSKPTTSKPTTSKSFKLNASNSGVQCASESSMSQPKSGEHEKLQHPAVQEVHVAKV